MSDSEQTIMTIPLPTQQANRTLRWLLKAVAHEKDPPVLHCVSLQDGSLIATDGYRLHAAPATHALKEIGNALLKFGKVRADTTLVDAELVKGNFPTVGNIIPKEEPVLEISLSGKYLREILADMTGDTLGRIRFKFYDKRSKPMEIFGKASDGSGLYALLMPMDSTYCEDDDWRPTDE